MPEPLTEGRDYTIDHGGRFIFTREFLLARGECCGSGCRNCPYGQPTADATITEIITPPRSSTSDPSEMIDKHFCRKEKPQVSDEQ